MQEFIMTVGLPASGKSTHLKILTDFIIISSDEYRERKYGNAIIQGNNNDLFNEIHKDIIRYIMEGKNIVLDATNLNYKHRMILLSQLNKYNIYKSCWLFATQYSICLERNKNRERRVPEYVIERMWKSFNCPQYYEGWNIIKILWDYNFDDYFIEDYINEARLFIQDNSHHSLSLGEHSLKVSEYCSSYDSKNYLLETLLEKSALLHDNGKRYTKVFHNMKGEKTEDSHYYQHEFCGAYEALFYLRNEGFSNTDVLYGCGLIQNHMRPYEISTDKSKIKLLNLIGQDMYNDLMILHEADKLAH